MRRNKPNKLIMRVDNIEYSCLNLTPALKRIPVYLTKTKRGYTCSSYVTIPEWALYKSGDYFRYYIAHELSHVNSRGDAHRAKYQHEFRHICPIELQHYELVYKKRAKLSAGATEIDLGKKRHV